MKITVDVWFVAEDGTLPITRDYVVSDDTDNVELAVLDEVLNDPDFSAKTGITVKVREATY